MNKAKQRLRVIVCGTTFGRIYLSGIEQLPEEYELVGILARGSANSLDCAQRYNVPLYTDIDQLPLDAIDVSCVVVRSTVVNGAGSELAEDLLVRGIHVIQEQPVHHDDMVKCIRIAYKSGCHYSVNSFYPDVEPVRRFILTARQALQQSEAVYLDAACSVHVLFPLVDILGQSLEGLTPWSFQPVTNSSVTGPLTTLCGQIGNIPVTLRVQNQINSKDPDNDTYLLHRIELCTNNGTLMLTDTHGLVLWTPHMHVPRRNDGVLDIDGSDSNLNLPVTELVQPLEKRPLKTIFIHLWPESIKRTLHRFWQTIVSGERDKHLNQYQLTACRVWQDIGNKLGLPETISSQNLHPLALADVQALTEDIKEGIYAK